MDKCLEIHNLPKLNQKGAEHLNVLLKVNEIKAVIKTLPANTRPGPDGFTSELYPSKN